MLKKIPKKNTKKTKSTTKENYQKFLSLNTLISSIAVIAIVTSLFLYIENQNLIEENQKTKQQIQTTTKEKVQEEQRAKYFEEKTRALEIEYANNPDDDIYIQTQPKQEAKPDAIVKKDEVKLEKPVISNKPKLAIIIDDVTTKTQMNKIKSIGYPVNMSFLPPTPRHRSSAKIASSLDNYMIHLPLQASTSKYDEKNTLYINDSIETIEKRIDTLSKLYPKAKYINNHTGSKFTSNQEAMDRLFKVLKKYDYIFIDSKTTAQSKARNSAKKYGVKLYSRNIFLDNQKDGSYIQNQLQRAINIAKKTGLSIAIGHPYDITFSTLKNSKKLLEGVEVIYVESL